MGKGVKSRCNSASHQHMKDRAKSRVDDLQGVFTDLQSARKESRSIDVAILEEQVHQMLREWKAELDVPTPASSLHENSVGSLNLSDIRRLLLCEEEDDATSPLTALTNPKPEPDNKVLGGGENAVFEEDCSAYQAPEDCNFHEVDHNKSEPSPDLLQSVSNNLEPSAQLDYQQCGSHQDFSQILLDFDNNLQREKDVMSMHNVSVFLPNICPPPSAFMGPKCALWDCPRPAQGSEWYQDYCSNFHATLALSEGQPGMAPVLRPCGIDLKDGPLVAALAAKSQGKDVGIPECEGAATSKSPWNAPELFDLSFLEGESIREWLFFDKPRRAFESGNRKQRSLPDYGGRGWHESRKQVLKEFCGLKRSYYMDPQPMKQLEWHLYEYEVDKCDACALYRLELKLAAAKRSPKGKIATDTPIDSDAKMNPNGKVATDSLLDLQKQMGRLSAEFPLDSKRSVKGRAKANLQDNTGNTHSTPYQMPSINGSISYGINVPHTDYVESSNDFYGT